MISRVGFILILFNLGKIRENKEVALVFKEKVLARQGFFLSLKNVELKRGPPLKG
jgi:hypothetical protein